MTFDKGDSGFSGKAEISDEELADIAVILNLRRGFRLSAYKSKCVKRRVAIRMRYTGCHDATAYCIILRQSEQELDLLQKALTIHVSQFFRSPSMFEMLRADVMPGLFMDAEMNAAESIRICSLGCACGEEPYSLALMLRDHFYREMRDVRIEILGIDIDAGTIQTAQKGEYREDHLKETPTAQLERHFRRHGHHFTLNADIREMVTFIHGDIASADKYLRSNLILCRNTLIYFNRFDQERILGNIAKALPSGGVLVLGKSETLVGEARRSFTAISSKERIYRRI